ncbi:LRR domain containing protein, partial [Parasponia andersonii]
TSKLNYLNMSFNLLHNTLPYFPIVGADKVDLSFNQIQGSIPPSLSNASEVYLSNNKFTNFRAFLCEAESGITKILDLSDNHLSGSLPDCWGNFQFLSVVDLGNNKLSGEIPSSISLTSTYIQTLKLRHNNFSGKLPSSLKNCTQLKVVDFGKNSLKGTIPSWIGESLTSLVFLSLKSNKFYGSIPLNLCHLSQIQILDLSLNDLSGGIPWCIKNFTSMVENNGYPMPIIPLQYDPNFLLAFNNIDGYDNIASIMWKGEEYDYDKILGLLRILDLSSNKLTGEIPIGVTHLV